MKKTVLLAVFALFATANPASAATSENRSAVAYSDLNLASAAGRATLDHRIDKAVRAVCRNGPTRSIRAAQQARDCMAEVKSRIAPMRERMIAEATKTQPSNTLARVKH
ncbi:MAG: UrcA family protein [Pseudomonadota bacterium]